MFGRAVYAFGQPEVGEEPVAQCSNHRLGRCQTNPGESNLLGCRVGCGAAEGSLPRKRGRPQQNTRLRSRIAENADGTGGPHGRISVPEMLRWITGSRIQTWPRNPSRPFSFGMFVDKRAWVFGVYSSLRHKSTLRLPTLVRCEPRGFSDHRLTRLPGGRLKQNLPVSQPLTVQNCSRC